MTDRVPSDGGGKAREWTLCRIDLDLMSRGDVLPPRVVVVEKEWADRQLAEALDVMESALEHEPEARPHPLIAYLKQHGRLPDDS